MEFHDIFLERESSDLYFTINHDAASELCAYLSIFLLLKNIHFLPHKSFTSQL